MGKRAEIHAFRGKSCQPSLNKSIPPSTGGHKVDMATRVRGKPCPGHSRPCNAAPDCDDVKLVPLRCVDIHRIQETHERYQLLSWLVGTDKSQVVYGLEQTRLNNALVASSTLSFKGDLWIGVVNAGCVKVLVRRKYNRRVFSADIQAHDVAHSLLDEVLRLEIL